VKCEVLAAKATKGAISEHISIVSCPVISVGNEIGGLRLLRYGGLKSVV